MKKKQAKGCYLCITHTNRALCKCSLTPHQTAYY